MNYTNRFFLLVFILTLESGCSNNKAGSADKKVENKKEVKMEANKVVSIARIEPETKIINLSSEVSGILKKVYIKSGDKVEKDQILFELSDDIEVAQLNQNKANIQVVQSSKADLEASLQSYSIQAENSRSKYERLKAAAEKGAEIQQNVDNAETEYKTYLQEMEKLKAQINNNNKQVLQSSAQAQLTEVQLNRRIVRSPSKGTILTSDLQPGMAITALTPLIEFAPDSPYVAICEVDELFAIDVAVGQKAYIRSVGRTDTLAVGEVTSVAPNLKKKSLFSDQSGDLEDRRIREVKVRLEKNDKLIYGMRVEAVILFK